MIGITMKDPAGPGERLYNLVLNPTSGATFPVLDSNNTNPNADPTSFSGPIASQNPSSAIYVIADSPKNAFVNGENVKQFDLN